MKKNFQLAKITQHGWFWPVVAVAALGLITRGGFFVALAPLLKFVWPLALIYLAYRWAKLRLKQKLAQQIYRASQQFSKYGAPGGPANGFGARRQDENVIEICPTCGIESKRCPH